MHIDSYTDACMHMHVHTYAYICTNTFRFLVVAQSFILPRVPIPQLHPLFFFFLIYLLFIYLFLAALGLRCCARAFSTCGERGLLLVAVRGLLIAGASLVAEHGL